jgi:hypothetical protein
MVKQMAAVVLGLVLLAVPAHTATEVRQQVKYAFLLTIDSTDSRQNVIGTIRGNGSLLDLIEGRDPETAGNETWFNRYVLKPSLLPVGTPEIPTIAFVGINAGVPAVVRNEYSQNTAFWRTVEFRGYTPAATRQFMQDYLKNLAWQDGATHYWHIVPGDSLSGDLPAHFVPIN